MTGATNDVEIVRHVIGQILELPAEAVERIDDNDDLRFSDPALDSLGLLRVVSHLERLAGVPVDVDPVDAEIVSIQWLASLLDRRTGEDTGGDTVGAVLLAEALIAHATSRPDEPAIVDGPQRVSWAELAGSVRAWMAYLTTEGVGVGAPVVIWCREGATATSVMLATWLLGAIPVPLDPTRPRTEVQQAMQAAHASHLVTSTEADLLDPAVRADLIPEGLRRTGTGSSPVGIYFYTSGTTGTSKCAFWDSDILIDSARHVLQLDRTSEDGDDDDVYGTTLRPELGPALVAAILPAVLRGRPIVFVGVATAASVLRTVAATRVTVLVTVPAVLRVVLDHAEAVDIRGIPGLRRLVTSAAGLDTGMAAAALSRLGCLPQSLYGSSEAGLIAFNDSDDPDVAESSVGRPIPGVVITVRDPVTSKPLTVGSVGELVVGGDRVPVGYIDHVDLQRLVYREDGVHSGDLGYVDERGFVYLTGRISTTINMAGYMVSPDEVEQALLLHPAVKDALVFGVPIGGAGFKVVARVITDRPTTPGDLRRHCAAQLASFKVPGEVEQVIRLEYNSMGKVRRSGNNIAYPGQSPE